MESSPYRRDIKRAGKGMYSKTLDEELPAVIDALAKDETLPLSYKTTSFMVTGKALGNATSSPISFSCTNT